MKKKLTKKVKKEIIDRVSGGEPVTEICKDAHMPTPSLVYKAQVTDTEFFNQMSIAYNCCLHLWVDELNYISNTPATILYPHLEFKEAEATARRRQDALKYFTSKLAPQLSRRWDKATKVEHTGNTGGPQILIQHYGDSKPKQIEGRIIDERK